MSKNKLKEISDITALIQTLDSQKINQSTLELLFVVTADAPEEVKITRAYSIGLLNIKDQYST